MHIKRNQGKRRKGKRKGKATTLAVAGYVPLTRLDGILKLDSNRLNSNRLIQDWGWCGRWRGSRGGLSSYRDGACWLPLTLNGVCWLLPLTLDGGLVGVGDLGARVLVRIADLPGDVDGHSSGLVGSFGSVLCSQLLSGGQLFVDDRRGMVQVMLDALLVLEVGERQGEQGDVG